MVSINYSLQKISTIVGGTFLQKGDSKNIAAEVLIDSRRLSSPDNTLFVALITKNNDGHNYVPELYEKGVRNFMLSREPEEPEISNIKEANILLVDDTLKALQKLAAYHRRQFTMPVIGISGSNGKTVVKEWLYQLLQEDYHIVRSPKSFNSQVGVPLSVLQMHENHNLAIVEAGISETDEMDRLVNIIKPDIGVFTNIGAAHDENFINRLQKAGEKLKLFTSVDVLVYCSDHYEIREQIIKSEIWRKIDIFEWSTSNEADLRVKRTEKKDRQTLVVADYGKKSVQMTIPFTDKASVENAIHCWMVMLYLGYKQAVISKRIQTLSPVAMRLELKEGINHCSVINDSYNSDITSLEIALDFMNQQNQHKNKTVLLSDILQSGLSSYHLYTKVAKLL
ncbi:MAG: Mur ligase family protein, partial [Bacteroidales bacterium]